MEPSEALARAWDMAKVDPDPAPLPVRMAAALRDLGYELRPVDPTAMRSMRDFEKRYFPDQAVEAASRLEES